MMLLDVFKFYFAQEKPLKIYAPLMCLKRILYYVKEVLFKALNAPRK